MRFKKYLSTNVFIKMFMAPFALVTVLVMRLLKIFIHFKVFEVYKHRIGHFALETELAALKSKYDSLNGKKTTIFFYFPDRPPANHQLQVMFRRELKCVSGNWGWLIGQISKFFKDMNITAQRTTIDRHGLLTKLPKMLEFTTEENEHRDIENLGLRPNQKFVCLHVRDSAFASQFFNNSSHQTFRNSEIETYLNASGALAERGYTIYRIGVKVHKKLLADNPRIIDYATNGMRTDFLDIYLAHEATFIISTASGWDSVPTIFRRPILKVNVLPIFAHDILAMNHLLIPKILCDFRSKKPMTLDEIIDRDVSDLYVTGTYRDAGVEIRDLSSEELVEAVTEMAQRVEGTFVETPEQKEMQAKLKQILSTHPKLQPSPNYYPIRAQFASCFLSRYPNFLDGLD